MMIDNRAKYGEKVYEKLAKDLQMCVSILELAVRFSREFSIPEPAQKLRWTHYTALLAVKDPQKRAEFIKKIEARDISTKQLRLEVAQFNAKTKAKALEKPAVPVQLPVNRGKLYTYQIIYPKPLPVEDEAYINLGFNFWRHVGNLKDSQHPLPKAGGSEAGLKEGALITSLKKDEKYSILPASAGTSAKELYTYKAYLEKVVDGDTIWLNIDVGFNNISRQKVRFNGIDTPEIATPDGPKAKRFVENALKGLDFFVVKTYKSDKYDRYLTDIFFDPSLSSSSRKKGKGHSERQPNASEAGSEELPGEPDPQVVADTGRYLNQELLDAGLASIW